MTMLQAHALMVVCRCSTSELSCYLRQSIKGVKPNLQNVELDTLQDSVCTYHHRGFSHV